MGSYTFVLYLSRWYQRKIVDIYIVDCTVNTVINGTHNSRLTICMYGELYTKHTLYFLEFIAIPNRRCLMKQV